MIRKLPHVVCLCWVAFWPACAALADEEVPRLPYRFSEEPETPEALVTLFVEGQAGLLYEDNVLRSPDNEQSDVAAIVAPRVRVVSRTDERRWEASLEVEGGKYDKITGNDYVDADARYTGQWRISEQVSLAGGARLRDDHQPIGTFADNPERAARDATEYRRGDADFTASYFRERWLGEARVDLRAFDYDNVQRVDGSVIFNDDRDRTELDPFAKIGYRFSERFTPYAWGMLNQRSYDENVEGEAFDRSSDGTAFGGGLTLGEPDSVVYLDVRMGWWKREFDAAQFADVDELLHQAQMIWLVSDTLHLTGTWAREIKETTLTGASSSLDNDLDIKADYAWRSNLGFRARARYIDREFQINKALRPGRTDDVYLFGLGATYRFMQQWFVDLAYDYRRRDSNDDTVEYTAQSVLLALGARF